MFTANSTYRPTKYAPLPLPRPCARIASLCILAAFLVCIFSACTTGFPLSGTPQQPITINEDTQAIEDRNGPAAAPSLNQEQENEQLPQAPLQAETTTPQEADSNPEEIGGPLTFPTGWLISQQQDIPAGTPVNILYTHGFTITANRNGLPVGAEEQNVLSQEWNIPDQNQALVEYEGRQALVPENTLFVNLPDVLPEAEFDIVYSYNTTSQCAAQDISGVTGTQLPGYRAGKSYNSYLAKEQFVVPCAYQTALKAASAHNYLLEHNYKLLVFDAYRPMTAQYYLSDSFARAYQTNTIMQQSMGAWSLDWYVADGPSGHNFGTDLDVGVASMDGTPLPMPSKFDAFDETGHLTTGPLNQNAISPDNYREEVRNNSACMALHDAFKRAGFSELSSEWWHFGDETTEGAIRAEVGSAGLDFEANLAPNY